MIFRRRFFRFAFPVVALAGAAFLFAGCQRRCGWRHDPQHRADWIAKKVASELGLDAAQKAKLDTIKAALLARQADFKAVHAGFKDLLIGQIRAGSVDTAKLNQGLDERAAKMKELRGFLVAEFAEFHAMLTPAQREKLAAKLEGFDRHCR
jgi:Spy/CpxP family protein refolding chaperone